MGKRSLDASDHTMSGRSPDHPTRGGNDREPPPRAADIMLDDVLALLLERFGYWFIGAGRWISERLLPASVSGRTSVQMIVGCAFWIGCVTLLVLVAHTFGDTTNVTVEGEIPLSSAGPAPAALALVLTNDSGVPIDTPRTIRVTGPETFGAETNGTPAPGPTCVRNPTG